VSRDLNLSIRVQGIEKLRELDDTVARLKSAAPGLKTGFEAAAKATDSLGKEFGELKAAIEGGFKGLSTEFAKIAAGIKEVSQAAKTQEAEIAATTRKNIERVKAEAVTVRELRQAYQALYESRLKGGKTEFGYATLESFKTRGVTLSPDDRVRLQAQKEYFAAVKESNSALEEQVALLRQAKAATWGTGLQGAALQGSLYGRTEKDQADLAALRTHYEMMERIAAEGAAKVVAAKAGIWGGALQGSAIQGSLYGRSAADQAELSKLRNHYVELERVTREGAARVAAARAQQWGSALQGTENLAVSFSRSGRTEADNKQLADMARYYSDLERESKRSGGALRDHTRSVNEAKDAYATLHSALRGTAGGLGQIWLSWGRPLAALWAGFAVSTGIRESIKQFAEFQHQMTVAKAVSEESQVTIDRVTEAALRLGTEGAFGPLEMASAVRVLVQAGLQAQQALEALPVVKDFATVGEMDMGPAAQSLIGITTAFGQPMSNMARISDIIGKAAAVTQTSIQGLTEAMRQASVVAEQYGADANEVAAVLSILAKRNIEGSRAGTAMRNAYNEIYAPGDKAKKVLQELGIQAYEADGRMKPLLQVFGELRSEIVKYNKESQNNILQTIFGERGGKVGSAILNDLSTVSSLYKEIEGSTGFSKIASQIIENESATVKWAVAMNTLSQAFIEAGRAAEPSLKAASDALRDLFASEDFRSLLNATLATIADTLSFLAENLKTVGGLFLVYLGAKTLGMLAALAGSFLLVASSAKTKAVAIAQSAMAIPALIRQYGLATVAANGFSAAQIAAAQASAGAAASGMLSATRMSGFAMGAARVVPVIGNIATAIGIAALAWDFFKDRQQNAMQALQNGASEYGKSVEGISQHLQDRADRAREVIGGNLSANSAVMDPLYDQHRKRVQLIDEEEKKELARRLEDRRYQEEVARNKRLMGTETSELSGDSQADIARQVQEQYQARRDSANAQFAADKARLEKQAAETRKLEKLASDKQTEAFRLGTGNKIFGTPDDGMRQYNDPVGKEYSNWVAEYKAKVQEENDILNDRNKILKAQFDAALITEEEYNRRSSELEQERADKRLAAARQISGPMLDQYIARREEGIRKEYGSDPKKLEAQLRALAAETAKYRAQFGAEEREATRDASTTKTINELKTIARAKDRADGLSKLVQGQEREESSRDFAYRMQFMDSTTQALERRRLEIEDRWADMRLKAKQSGDAKWLDVVEDGFKQATDLGLEYERRRIESEKRIETGVLRGATNYLNEISNLASVGESLVRDTARGVEDFFVNMAKTGEISLKSLADMAIEQFTRIMVQQRIMGPLMKLLTGFIPGAPSAAATTLNNYNMALAAKGHTGGRVGYEAMDGMHMVSASLFRGASRYHSGGGIGLYPGEVPIIAKKGEMIFTEQQQAVLGNALNQKAEAPNVQVNIMNNGQPVNAQDTQVKFDGKQMIINVMLEDMARNGPITQRMNRGR